MKNIIITIFLLLAIPVQAIQLDTPIQKDSPTQTNSPKKSEEESEKQLQTQKNKSDKKEISEQEEYFFTLKDFNLKNTIDILALISSPLFAIWLSKHIEKSTKIREDQINIFKTLLTGYAYLCATGIWKNECIEALNLIHLVFSKNKDIKEKWKKYFSLLCKQSIDENLIKARNQAIIDLLHSIAKSLGYNEFFIKNKENTLYIPQSIKTEMDIENTYKNLQFKSLFTFFNNIKKPKHTRNSIWSKRK